MGYPTYYNGRSYTWTKGKLTRVHCGAAQQPGSLYADCKFTYDAYGRRLSKSYTYDPNTATTNDYSYTYSTTYNYDNSGRLLREYCIDKYTYSGGTSNSREFIYLYDESGMIGVLYSYNGSTPVPYYYHRNLQGDVIAIYDASGNVKAEYTYDAWGNCKVTNSTLYDLAYNNPIRYRGYYYDRETGLYYLNARYYNPEWRRFISPDSTEYIDAENPNGVNLYVYCNNDPINYTDPTGHITLLAFVISIGISLAFEALDDYLDGGFGDGSHDWKDYLGAGISGFFGALGGGIVAQAAYSLIGGFADAALSGDLEEDGFWNTMGAIATSSLISFGIGTLANRVASGIKASQLKKLSNRLGNNAANRKLRAMGATIKIGSNAAKAKGGLSKAIRTDSKWIGNVLSDKLPGSISGGIVSLGYGHLSEKYGWYF